MNRHLVYYNDTWVLLLYRRKLLTDIYILNGNVTNDLATQIALDAEIGGANAGEDLNEY